MPREDVEDRTEAPTTRRLQEAREQGRVPRSTDLTAALALLGALLLFKALGGKLFSSMLELSRAVGERPDVTVDGLWPWIGRMSQAAGRMVLPFLLLLMVLTVVATVLQSGMPFTLRRLVPSLDKLNPLNGIRRVFSLDSLTRMGLGIVKMVCVAAVAYSFIAGAMPKVLSIGSLHAHAAFQVSCELMYKLALRIAVTLLLLALLDYAYQRWNWWRNLKMTKQEVRDELKNMEGDPKIRARRRRMQVELAMQRLGLEVPKADVVVTNPTEYAVALRYDEETMSAPRVNAKGRELLALRIRQLAQEHGVPIVQRAPLARALYAAVEVGQEVPPAFYRAVAEVLAYVYQLAGRAATARSA